jgi:hypothetical protein
MFRTEVFPAQSHAHAKPPGGGRQRGRLSACKSVVPARDTQRRRSKHVQPGL